MRVNKTKSKNNEHYSIIQDINVNEKRTTKVYENIGNLEDLKLRAGDEDLLEWLKKYVAELNKKNKENSLPVIMRKNPNKELKRMYKTYLILDISFLKIFIIN